MPVSSPDTVGVTKILLDGNIRIAQRSMLLLDITFSDRMELILSEVEVVGFSSN